MITVTTVTERNEKGDFVAYHPQIIFNGERWQHQQGYTGEDAAYGHAVRIAQKANAAFRKELTGRGMHNATSGEEGYANREGG